MERSSALPPIDEVREQSTMQIITVSTKPFRRETVKTSLCVVSEGGKRSNVVSSLITFDDKRVKGYMPSKVWWNDRDECFDVLFYVNSSLPKSVRPFKDNTYLLYVYPQYGQTLEYDVNIRVFIDQVKTNVGMAHVFMFGDESYHAITMTPNKDIEL